MLPCSSECSYSRNTRGFLVIYVEHYLVMYQYHAAIRISSTACRTWKTVEDCPLPVTVAVVVVVVVVDVIVVVLVVCAPVLSGHVDGVDIVLHVHM